jgi:putative PIN family toxin of toxin-antitoxin system
VRAVLDPNVLIAALVSREGKPAEIVSRWLAGEFELVVSAGLLAELERALGYRKLRNRISPEEAAAFVELLRRSAVAGVDPRDPPRRSSDSGDDYLLALAESQSAVVVSGYAHLLELADRFPVLAPGRFLDRLRKAP